MWVGCLSTLRPLFRKIFSLGSLGGSAGGGVGGVGGASKGYGTGHGGLRSGSAFPSNARRTYDQFSSQRDGDDEDRDVEMGNMGTTSNAFKTSIQSMTKAHASASSEARGSSLSSDSDSVEQILKDAGKQGLGGGKGIVVSRQVQIQRS